MQHSEGGELMLLSRFSMEWPILQAGGLLLPKLVEFYQWLHTQLGRRSRERGRKESVEYLDLLTCMVERDREGGGRENELREGKRERERDETQKRKRD